MLRLIILAVHPIMWLHASGVSSAVIENFQLDKQNEVVTFDVKAVSTKPIRFWTATITFPDVAGTMHWHWTSDSCSLSKTSFHCSINVAAVSTDATPRSAEAEITAILFEDGTVEGDTAYLKNLSAARKSIFEAYDYWLTSFRKIQATRPVAEQLGTFAILLAAPSDLVMGEDLYPQWEGLKKEVNEANRRIQNGSAAEAEVSSFASRLENQQRIAKKGTETFPLYASNAVAKPVGITTTNEIASRATNLTILKTERRSGTLVAFFRNDYPVEIAGYAVAGTGGGRAVSTLSGGAAIAPGDTFEIRTPLPRDAVAQDLPPESALRRV